MGLGMGLRLTATQRMEQRLAIRQELRQSLVLAERLTFLTEEDEENARQVAYLKQLQKQDDEGLLRKLKRDVKADQAMKELALVCQHLINTLGLIDVRKVLARAVAAPDNGFLPLDFMSFLLVCLEWLPKEKTNPFFQAVIQWQEDRLFQGIEIAYLMLDDLASPEALFGLAELIAKQRNIDAFQMDDLKKVKPNRKLNEKDITLLFGLFDECSTLMVGYQESYWTSNRSEQASAFLDKDNCHTITEQYPKMPCLMVIAFQPILEESSFERLYGFAKEEYFQKSTDAKRALLAGLLAIQGNRALARESVEVMAHIINVCQDSRELIAVCREVRYVSEASLTQFPFQTSSAAELIARLHTTGLETIFNLMGLTEEQRNEVLQALPRLERRNMFNILTRLFLVHQQQNYEKGMELVRLILLKLVEKSYEGFRYNHEQAREQLTVLAESDAWKKNIIRTKYIGDLSGVEPAIAAIKQLMPILQRKFQSSLPEFAFANLESLQHQFTQAVEGIKKAQDQGAKRQAIARKQVIETAYTIVSVLGELERLSVDGFFGLPLALETALKRSLDYPLLYNVFAEVVSIYEKTGLEPEKIERITIEETDDLFNLINIGITPVKTCQRWTEPTSYNQALLSYVLDGNKKVVFIKGPKGEVISRSIIRLLPFTTSKRKRAMVPMLVVERPYSTRWSEDLACCLLQVLVEKAVLIAKENSGVCALAFSQGDNKSDLWQIFERRLQELKKHAHQYNNPITLPPSINAYEYSDTLAGAALIPSGKTVKAKLKVVLLEVKQE